LFLQIELQTTLPLLLQDITSANQSLQQILQTSHHRKLIIDTILFTTVTPAQAVLSLRRILNPTTLHLPHYLLAIFHLHLSHKTAIILIQASITRRTCRMADLSTATPMVIRQWHHLQGTIRI
jgi:hypothetical protein